MSEKVDANFHDPVEGPNLVDTEEQARTRSTHANEETDADRKARSEIKASTLQQNQVAGAGVDDRGAEDSLK